MTLRVFSFGGGVQSVAALVLASRGEIDYREFAFAHVGGDSEHPGTLAYLEEHAQPFAARHGLTIHVLRRTKRDGSVETVLGRLQSTARSISIPARMSNGAPGNRTCTVDFKIKVVAKWLKGRGATEADPATVGLGISVDEIHRARRESGVPWERLDYPLITPLRLVRANCAALIKRAGLPVPPKSACWFCPFHRPSEWQRMRREEPDLFQKAVEVERAMNEKRGALGRDRVWLTRFNKPLDMAIPDSGQTTMFEGDGALDTCESGYCMT